VDLKTLTVSTIFGVLLIFCRAGSCLMVLPGIGDSYVAIRFRLLISLVISIVIFPVIDNLPKFPESSSILFLIITFEIFTGIFIGLITRILFSTIHVAGLIIASQSGLGSAMLFDPSQGSQGAIMGNFLSLIAIVLLFSTNLHHMLIEGIADSYNIFIAGDFVNTKDYASHIIDIMNKSFHIAIKMVSPQIIISILLLLASGILARLMPSLQIFFLITPIQLLLSFFLIMVTLSVSMMWYLNYIQEATIGILAP
jgi:flagellar biosynthetic protein FliR